MPASVFVSPTVTYPSARMFGRLPSFELYCRQAKGARLSDLQIDSQVADPRPLLRCGDVDGLVIDGLRGDAQSQQMTQLGFKNVQNAFVRGSSAAERTESYLKVAGLRRGILS